MIQFHARIGLFVGLLAILFVTGTSGCATGMSKEDKELWSTEKHQEANHR